MQDKGAQEATSNYCPTQENETLIRMRFTKDSAMKARSSSDVPSEWEEEQRAARERAIRAALLEQQTKEEQGYSSEI
jgi:hypothetical protein